MQSAIQNTKVAGIYVVSGTGWWLRCSDGYFVYLGNDRGVTPKLGMPIRIKQTTAARTLVLDDALLGHTHSMRVGQAGIA